LDLEKILHILFYYEDVCKGQGSKT